MKRSEITYGQLDKVLKSLDFSYRALKKEPPARFYSHTSGAVIMLPSLPDTDRVYEYHLAAVRLELDNFGIATPDVFAAKLQKAG